MRGDEPMESRTLRLPAPLWQQIEAYAADLSHRERKPVSVAEAIRRILERSMKRRG